MVKDEAREQDLRFSAAAGGVVSNPNGFHTMEEDQQVVISDKNLWLDVNDASIFYDNFPALPEFPCMSSSSSTSSSTPPPPLKSITGTSSCSSATSSSPAASWPMIRPDAEEDTAKMSFQQLHDEAKLEAAALSSTASMDCLDVMENLDYMDLIDCNELWDPSSVFEGDNPPEGLAAAPPHQGDEPMICEEEDGFSFLQGNSELAMIFLEWLKQNKDYISAEDMRSIKLKRSTIESASKRLGNSKEGKKQLLKLILEWVEQYRLQKKEGGAAAASVQIPDPNANLNFIYNSDPNTQWIQPPPLPLPPPTLEVPTMVAPPSSFPPPMPGYSGAPYSNQVAIMNHGVVHGIPYHSSAEYPVMEHAPSWAMLPPPSQFSPFPEIGGIINRHQSLCGNPYQMLDPNGQRMMRLGSSATKEARKKRMARQRRMYSHHHRHVNQQQDHLNDTNLVGEGVEDCDQGSSLGNLVYWSAEAAQPNSSDRTTVQARQASFDRRQQQGWKTEKNLKLLLQKVLKQSDVGNLGRIVLPKKEAESHLPELETRDGISIAMEDIGTSRIWNMRYRFWPNNKSRMYLLENTGEFVRVNGLQEGDFIVIYSDTKCGKYMIRGVKVRHPGGKLEGKKAARRNIRTISSL